MDDPPSSTEHSSEQSRVEAPSTASVDENSAETRADRIRRRVANHPVGAIVVLGVSLVATVGGVVGGVRQIADLFDGPAAPAAATGEASPFDPSELKLAKNQRYGFSFQYPATWQRQDPVNGDGLAAIGPEPGLELVAYGRLPSEGPSPATVFERLDYQARQVADAARVIEAPDQQNVTRILAGGETTEVAGMRLVTEADATDAAPAVTTVALVTTTMERDVEMRCSVPTRLYSDWRGACNRLLSTLMLTR